ncbi:MAG TPA: solute carrier family 23 protein [Pseudonocardiaceae bacterium]|nr:solute carrier family 23 protein [Pseudonocardiaceae bacterium]
MALWTVHGDGRRLAEGEMVRADERLSWPLTASLGLQHVAAMFAATVLVPKLTGFSPATTLLFSGLGTLLFLLLTRNRIPSYLGSSFAFVAPLAAARGDGVGAELGGVLFAGVLVVCVGIAVKALGVRLLESVMPPVVSGAVIMLVGLSLAPFAVPGAETQPGLAAVTVVVTGLCAVLSRGLPARTAVLLGVLAGWLVGQLSGNVPSAAWAGVGRAAWLGWPALQTPELRSSVMLLVLPAVIVLVAQNTAQVKAIGEVTGRNLDGNIGDALISGGLASMLAGAGGGSGLTTYASNIGVMAVTRVFSTAAYVVAAVCAIGLSCSPKVTAVLDTMPAGVSGGVTLVLCGAVAMLGVRVWMANDVDLTDPVNLMAGGTAVAAGVGDVTIQLGSMQFDGIVWGSLLIVLGYPLLRTLRGMRR